MKPDRSQSTSLLVQLCGGYFASYVVTGVLVKYFTGGIRTPKMSEMAYLFNNTLGGTLTALLVVVLLGWLKLESNRRVRVGPFQIPSEVAYIIPSGICTAIVIPTTTLMYSLPISVMVAMVIMRGSIIVISRLVDEVQIRQGLLHKRVYHAENIAVLFALLAVATNVLLLPLVDWCEGRQIHVAHWIGLKPGAGKGSFEFLHSAPAMTILALYITAYAFRIYIMNYYKNTRAKGVELDNKGFFAVEQIVASTTMVALAVFFFASPRLFGWSATQVVQFHDGMARPELSAIVAGVPYGIVAFFSVFIFMFKGRTATFAGLVNRLTSLLAGTTATLLLWVFWKTKFPSAQDWLSVLFILVAVWFLTRAEKQRVRELGIASTATEPVTGPLPAMGVPVRPR